MKVEYKNNILVVYTKRIDNIDDEELCKNVINKLKKYYGISLKGFYDVDLYVDNKNIVIEFIEDNIEVSDYYNRVDMNIRRINNMFLYEIKDLFDIKINYFYLYNDRYYLDTLRDNNREFVNVIYKNTKDILKYGKKIYV